MNDAEEKSSFFGYLMRADYRFLQERDLGIDLYNSGYCGLAVFVLAVAVVTIFLLSIFHMIPRRRHVTILLPGTGCLAFAFGLLGTWLNHLRLEEVGKVLFNATGGTLPVNVSQQAAIVILPLATGIAVLIASLAGYIYLLAFWASDLFRKQAEEKKQKGSVKTRAGR